MVGGGGGERERGELLLSTMASHDNISSVINRPLASFSKRVMVPFFTYEHKISFKRQFNSFVYKWLYYSYRFDSDA